MHTKDKLAAALREVGLDEMADKAATGYYHDFLSPLAFPDQKLADDLREERSKAIPVAQKKIDDLIHRHFEGEFDATLAESEDWMASPEGEDAMRRLMTGRP